MWLGELKERIHVKHLPKFLTHRKWSFCSAKSLQSCPTLCEPIDGSPPGSPRPWDSPGKNTGVGCHFLLQCRKVKSEREVAQSCPILCDPMDRSLPSSSIHGIFQARVLEWGAITFFEWSLSVRYYYCHYLLLLVLFISSFLVLFISLSLPRSVFPLLS